jgi:hypothetical protein
MSDNGAKISVYESVFETTPLGNMDINNFVTKIKQGWTKYNDTIQAIRALDPLSSKQAKKRYNSLKENLPCCTISGTFELGRNDNDIECHSGYLALDIDRKKDINKILLQEGGLEKVIELLKREPWVYAIFKSVGGRSPCCIVKIPASVESHEAAIEDLEKYFLETYELTLDASCKNVGRLRYISSDSDLYINQNAEVYQIRSGSAVPKIGINSKNNIKTKIPASSSKIINPETLSLAQRIVKQVVEMEIILGDDSDDSYDDWRDIAFALVDEFGESGRLLFHKISAVSSKYDQANCDKQYTKCLNSKSKEFGKNITIATFFHFAKERGLDITLPGVKKSQCEHLLKIASTLPLFHDQNKETYVFLDNEVVSLRSRNIKQYLSYQMYSERGKTPNSDSLNQTITTLEGKAIYESPKKELFNRVAQLDNAFWYDLGDGKAVKITNVSWNIENSPILFKRYSHQQAQVAPTGGGDPWKIFDFLNVDKDHQLLVLVYIISCFVPDIPHPIFHPHGSQGSGKTTLCRVIKKICDPSSIETLITPKELSQLTQVISHHHVCLFDNLSDLPSWMSDLLAQACTGGGYSKRRLYTDDDDVIYQVKRCIGLNGINLLVSKSDLMDRTILLHLERISPSKRTDEKELWENFERLKSEILGGIFDTLVKAKDIHSGINLSQLPRMADFAKWGYAITEALGHKGDDFMKAYQQNVERQNEEVIQYNTLAQTVVSFMNDKDTWNGMIKEVWEELQTIAAPDKKDSTFPKTHRTLRKYLEKIKPNLMDIGITYEISGRSASGYPIAFQKSTDLNSNEDESVSSLSQQIIDFVMS